MTQTISGSLSVGITLTVPTTVTAAGRIHTGGQITAVMDGAGPGTLVNYGAITAAETAISLAAGGVIDNLAGGSVYGVSAILAQDMLTVDNAGMLSGIGAGINAYDAVITNELGGIIDGGISAATALIVNHGTVSRSIGDLINLTAGGTVSNLGTAAHLTGINVLGVMIAGGAGTVTNQGAISGISLQSGGSVLNQGYVGLGAALYGIGISGPGPATVDNEGTAVGVGLFNGGVLTNDTSGLISGNYNGADLAAGGNLANSGSILGLGGLAGELDPGVLGGAGVYLGGGSGVISNATGRSLIAGTKYGVELSGAQGGDFVVNYGLIEGAVGIRDFGAMNNIIDDFGTIAGTGGVAVQFGAGNDLLILAAGAQLQGKVEAGAGTDVVEFNSNPTAGSIGWISADFIGNVTFVNETPILSLTGFNTVTPGEILDNTTTMEVLGTLDVYGTLENSGGVIGGFTLGNKYNHQVPLVTPAVLDNDAGGCILSTLAPAIIVLPNYYPSTIENAGTIENTSPGGIAISFSAGQADLLILDPGSKIIGTVDGGNTAGSGGSVLELAAGASQGTIAPSDHFVNFSAVTIDAGASWEISGSTFSALTNDGTIILDPTTLMVQGNLAGVGVTKIEANSELILQGAAAAGETIAFGGTNGILDLADSSGFAGKIDNIGTADTVDLSSFKYNSKDIVLELVGNAIDIVGPNTYAVIQFGPAAGPEYFHLSSDGLNGTDVTENAVPCFLAGTMIATPDGETPVQDLRIGDPVMTSGGPARPVKWIGRRRYAAPLPDNPDIIPVCIKAGALAANVPARDLYLSPLHAVAMETFLVPAGALVNGVSVLSRADITEIDYFHIELEEHGIVLANGAPAETFVDEDSRRMFDNADDYARLYPRQAPLAYLLCAPRLEFGPELERLRRKIALRAGIMPGRQAGAVIGYLETADRQTITGWAYAPNQPNVPVCLEIFNGGALLARTVANTPRPDVKLAGFGNGRCGFSICLPAPLPALMRHEISVRPVGEAACLSGSPSVIDPAIAHDLLKSGGLRGLLDAAVKGLGSAAEIAVLGNSLEAFGKQIKLQAGTPHEGTPHEGTRHEGTRRLPGGRARPGVLVLDQAWPTVTLDAGSNAIMSHIIGFQQLGYKVIFCASSGPPQTAAACAGLAALQALGVDCAGQGATAPEQVIRDAAGRGLAAVYLHRLATAAAYGGLARQYAPAAQVIFALADLHHLRLARQAQVTGRPDLAAKARAVKTAEFWAMQLADCVITHSRFEAAYLREQAPAINVHVVPWAVANTAPARATRNRAHIAFIGGANHAPNVDAVQHLARDIMPIVWRRNPLIRCLIAGDCWPENFFSKLDLRIVNLGYQENLTPLLHSVKLTVAPLRFGAGVKGKVLASMAAGTACVMSDVAAEGLPLDQHLRALTGDGARLAANILALHGNRKLNRVAAQAGLDMIDTSFSEAATVAALAAALGVRQGKRMQALETMQA